MAIQKKSREQGKATDSGSLHKHGEGLGTGPVGQGGRTEGTHAGQSQNPNPRPSGNSGQQRPGSQGSGSSQRPSSSQKTDDKGLVDSLFSTNTSSSSSSSSHQSSGLGSGLFGGGSGSSSSGGGRKGSLLILIIAAIALFFLWKSCSGGSQNQPVTPVPATSASNYSPTSPSVSPTVPTAPSENTGFNVGTPVSGSGLSSVLSGLGLSNLLGGTGTGSFNLSGETASASSAWSAGNNIGVLNQEVAAGAAKKRTKLLGNGRDVVTVMVYMCGTDLESKYQMGTLDLQEMLSASSNPNLNLIVYTGGCSKWQNNVVSSQHNMAFQIRDGKINMLVENAGNPSMTNPDTLTEFIKYCDQNFPANRNMLILWDHGGGSISGYGYDEKYARQGAMSLDNVEKALKNANVEFDIIGYDACLMATYETAHVASKFADYMIASEESEPGVGWYYTPWLDALAKNTSMSSLEIGKNIIDGFVDECGRKCPGQATTLSLIDLAEFSSIQDDLDIFSGATNTAVNSDFKQVASSRAASHEFGKGNRLDQVDLVDLAARLNTSEATAFATKILSAIKYNRTSAGITNAYGLSIYFPMANSTYVDQAVKLYKKIGLKDSYIKLVQNYASMQVSGQATSNYAMSSGLDLSSILGGGGSSASASSLSGLGGSSLLSSGLLNMLGGGSNASSSSLSGGDISGLLGSLLGGGTSSNGLDLGSLIGGLGSSNTGFFSGRDLSNEQTGAYLAAGNLFDAANLNWKEDDSEHLYITMPDSQWKLVTDLALSMYYDDSEGYIDLGIDNVYSFDKDGNLLAPENAQWMTVNGQFVAYYYENGAYNGEEYIITGYIPALLNGEQVRLIAVFDNEHPEGYIAGAQPVYKNGETELQAKSLMAISEGDKIEFIADYYTYDGKYEDSYRISTGDSDDP
ncbi:MAG: hypothetical protein IIY77_08415, partial [Lachnospiraceae bacterium]|nr:hypothetical protein [Lachnospiraceae bacterium]